MYIYAFQLGRQKDLSHEEIAAVFTQKHIRIAHTRLVGEFLLLSVETPIDAKELMQQLGGTKLIGEKLDPKGNAEDTVFAYLHALPSDQKLHFSLSGGTHASKLAIAVKKKLKKIGRSVRYVETKNTATILHNNLVEKGSHLTIIDNVVYITRAIQPFEEMSERDYGRPSIDDKSGMLPPKLARMMINLAMPEKENTLLDPFCGSGTLLGEAISLGFEHIIGSDISDRAIDDSKKNIAWLRDNFKYTLSHVHIFESDIRSLSEDMLQQKVDIIATEPYMGIPRTGHEQKVFLQKQTEELKQLYIDAFRIFKKIIKPDGCIIFVIPRFRYKEEWITVDCQRDIEKLGFRLTPYEQSDMPLVYARDEQFVAREIWRWELSK
ncbi:MAG: hypothetical protein CO030_02030 [Candidatus Magasanikbacteria bacterium CG_4_9_14_0_2_um_filter_42_11]|uniref:Ribosomal RNA large subunit methyltransferase K/L-like methyltransferase domain-containing protein n=1 Tax=Candidatus Magasanikbacteria bacterium CG_4_9_14_0_2_um_filter_42_11 TaxID=1974643 RepID=A0A2M8FA33_9BACT|nr:MAG: hypothetical protein COU34_00120 [Candidatus Magasanikbacteria bacterium CG10_big_fil_rev_8_21_14_0_10_43_9]PIY92773.1 MAG: hypothetical protein COY70_01460 [Candidatus Magasanikbacteria bacterium CG_4_10_14_0_8_um_filter_42_12]PJC52592.1 MAG: hypothetical protein CO030_02030 [Candidatus Magasanikbacteria bacterium CG_4_9_14_0_2_um_filter_42_11]